MTEKKRSILKSQAAKHRWFELATKAQLRALSDGGRAERRFESFRKRMEKAYE